MINKSLEILIRTEIEEKHDEIVEEVVKRLVENNLYQKSSSRK